MQIRDEEDRPMRNKWMIRFWKGKRKIRVGENTLQKREKDIVAGREILVEKKNGEGQRNAGFSLL